MAAAEPSGAETRTGNPRHAIIVGGGAAARSWSPRP
jgi:hypothetical protein